MTIGLMVATVVGILTLFGAIGTFAFGVWQSGRWVGEINTALQGISMDIKIVKNDQTELKLKWDNHESRLLKIETAGSPNVQELSKQMAALQRAIDLHMAQERSKP